MHSLAFASFAAHIAPFSPFDSLLALFTVHLHQLTFCTPWKDVGTVCKPDDFIESVSYFPRIRMLTGSCARTYSWGNIAEGTFIFLFQSHFFLSISTFFPIRKCPHFQGYRFPEDRLSCSPLAPSIKPGTGRGSINHLNEFISGDWTRTLTLKYLAGRSQESDGAKAT